MWTRMDIFQFDGTKQGYRCWIKLEKFTMFDFKNFDKSWTVFVAKTHRENQKIDADKVK